VTDFQHYLTSDPVFLTHNEDCMYLGYKTHEHLAIDAIALYSLILFIMQWISRIEEFICDQESSGDFFSPIQPVAY